MIKQENSVESDVSKGSFHVFYDEFSGVIFVVISYMYMMNEITCCPSQ